LRAENRRLYIVATIGDNMSSKIGVIYRNKHNHRQAVCVNVKISDYGISTYTLQDVDDNRKETWMSEFDMKSHWRQVSKPKVEYAWRTRVRKGDEEE